MSKITTDWKQTRKIAEKKAKKRYKCFYSYYIEDVSKETLAFDRINGKVVRMFLQDDGTFSTDTGFSRKKFKTKFFAKLYIKKRNWKDVIIIKRALFHSKYKDFEDFEKEYVVEVG